MPSILIRPVVIEINEDIHAAIELVALVSVEVSVDIETAARCQEP